MKFLLVISLLFVLAGCVAPYNEYSHQDALAAAIYEGIIIDPTEIEVLADIGLDIAPIELSDIGGTRSIPIGLRFAIEEGVSFEHNRYFHELYVEVGQMVSAGDVLASSVFEPSDIALAQYRRARSELERFRTDNTIQRYNHHIEIDETRLALELASGNDWERYAIRLRQQELNYERFTVNSARTLERLQETLDERAEYLANEQIVAPFDGLVVYTSLIREEQPTTGEIVRIVDVNSFYFLAQAPSAGVLLPQHWQVVARYGDIFQMTLAEHELYVQVVSDPIAAGFRLGEAEFIVMPLERQIVYDILEELDNDWLMLGRLPLRVMHPVWNKFGEGIVLPQWAVHTDGWIEDNPNSFVVIYEGGVFRRRYVTVGPYFVQLHVPGVGGMRFAVYVIDGIEPGQKVVGAQW